MLFSGFSTFRKNGSFNGGHGGNSPISKRQSLSPVQSIPHCKLACSCLARNDSSSKPLPAMLPTIDISLIGIVVAIWSGIKALGHFFMVGLNYVKNQAITLVIGSRLWATAFFLAAFVAILLLLSTCLSSVASMLAQFVVSSIPGSLSASLGIINSYIHIDLLLRPLATLASVYLSLFVVDHMFFIYLWLVRVHQGLSRVFKL